MAEDLNTLEGCRAFLRRIRDEAVATGIIALRPHEFVRAVEIGAIEYVQRDVGVSFNGQYVGEYAPEISGIAVRVA